MDTVVILKALADDTRYKMLKLLLERSYCVRALARILKLSDATISQHLKVLKEAGLVVGEKKGYFMHYNVQKDILLELSNEMRNLLDTERVICGPNVSSCPLSEQENCRQKCKKKANHS